jgi:beta-lactamase class A
MKLFYPVTIIFCILFVGSNLYLVNRQFREAHPGMIISPLSDTVAAVLPSATVKPRSDMLKKIIDKSMAGSRSTYGVVVKNLETGENYSVNAHRSFEPASLYKLWVMATVFNQIENGFLKLTDTLSQPVSVLNDNFGIDPENAEQTEGTITQTVEESLKSMITISDNYSALLLSDRIKNSTVKKYLVDHGFTESSLGEPPVSTPSDIAQFLEKLYLGNLANPENTQTMLNFLKEQTLNSKIPRYLPVNTVIAHKTGEINSYTHDAGIVYLDKNPYIIVLMSEGDDTVGAEERIAGISKAVYDYFSR